MFALVPIDEYERMKQKQFVPENPTMKSLGEANSEMDQILKRTDLTPERQSALYEMAKHRYTALDKMEDDDDTLKELLQTREAVNMDDPTPNLPNLQYKPEHAKFYAQLPRQYYAKLSHSLDHITKHPDVLHWNEKGEAIVHGHVIPHSNIHKLVYNMFIEQKHETIPHRNEFLSALDHIDFPGGFMSNSKARDALKAIHDAAIKPPAQEGKGLGPPGIRVSHKHKSSRKSSHKATHKAKHPRILRLYRI